MCVLNIIYGQEITIVPVNNSPIEEATQQVEDMRTNEEATLKQIQLKLNPRQFNLRKQCLKLRKQLNRQTIKQKLNKELISNMEINGQLVKQVQCQACGKSMSAKNLKCSHAAYCANRAQEVDKPKAITVPKTKVSLN